MSALRVVVDNPKPEPAENDEIERLYADFKAALARQKPAVKLPPPLELDE